ncbi:hypothetical protein ACFSHT_06205 [Paraburkholderia silviterrae]|uniref:Uncharacterized protein n=1 Tax=Paraburkholderia silviterrae TaxID=2528715 RepID=A0A4R5MC43_9BURK|nr:hypothetical protein [Paraburkholderia silviterrae]TDG24496.1 hypothetical protein EYW47_08000 [Paraburkholderia silviterrae]
MHNSLNELKALSEAIKNTVVDPDLIDYPHLFVKRTYPDDEMGSYDGPTVRVDPYIVPEKYTETDFASPVYRSSTPRNLKPFSGIHKPVPKSRLKAVGWKRPKGSDVVTCVEPDEWIDLDTGEILTKAMARKRGAIPYSSISLRMITTQVVFNQCPPSKHDFLSYILKLRSRRGGLVTDLKSVLDKWIDYKHPNIHSTDRSRKRKSLEKFLYNYAIMTNNQIFMQELQVMANTTKTDNVREAARFVNVLPVKGKPGCGICPSLRPD